MTRPRPVYPGATNFSTRSVHKRQFLLRPSDEVNHIIEYTTAVLSDRYGIEIHALCVESGHKHDVATDPHGLVVDFERDMHELIARQINRLHGESGSMWERKPSGRAECLSPEKVLDKIVYTMINPVKDRLVAHGKSWPGVRRAWPAVDKIIKRPKGFFRDEESGGTWPETATLRFTRPPGFDHLSDDELARRIQDAIEAEEAKFRALARAEGKRFLGRRRCLEMSRYAYPVSERELFGINPEVVGPKELRIAALERRKVFREEHAEARLAFYAGDREVLFPYGTWKMRRYCGAGCRPPPG